MDSVKVSVVCIIISGIAGSLAVILIPGKKNNHIMKGLVSIFIILSLFEPLKNIFNGLSDFSIGDNEAVYSYSVISETVSEYITEEIEDIINSTADKYEIKINNTEIKIANDENCIIIQNVIVRIEESDYDKALKFRNELCEAAGVEVNVVCE